MNPELIRNESWHSLRGRLEGMRRDVYEAWMLRGPGTTRQVAGLSGIDILNVRPRTTELVDLGLLVCCGRAGNEGVYRAATEIEWRRFQEGVISRQLTLL